jgi:hypothetical protein
VKRLVLLASLVLGAAAPAPRPAGFVAALFVHACLAHPGDIAGMRAAAGALPRLAPPPPELGRPGEAFDAGGGVALRFYGNTWCEVRADDVDRDALIRALDAALRDAGATARLQDDRPWQDHAGSRVRTYAALRDGRRLAVWLGTWATSDGSADGGTAASLMLMPKE